MAGSSKLLRTSDDADQWKGQSIKFAVAVSKPPHDPNPVEPYPSGNAAVFHQRASPSVMWMGLGNGLDSYKRSKQLAWALSNVIKNSLKTPDIVFDVLRYRTASVTTNTPPAYIDEQLSSPSVMLQAAVKYTTLKFSKNDDAAAYYTLARFDTNTGFLSYVNTGENQMTAWRMSSSPGEGYQNILKTNEQLTSARMMPTTRIDISREDVAPFSNGLPSIDQQMQIGDIIVMGSAAAFENLYLSSADFEDIATNTEDYEFTGFDRKSITISSTDSIEHRRKQLSKIPTVKSIIESIKFDHDARIDLSTDRADLQLSQAICTRLSLMSLFFQRGDCRNPSIYTLVDVPSSDQSGVQRLVDSFRNRIREAITSQGQPNAKMTPYKSVQTDKFQTRSAEGSEETSKQAGEQLSEALTSKVSIVPKTKILRILETSGGPYRRDIAFQCGIVSPYSLCKDLREMIASNKLIFKRVLHKFSDKHNRPLTVEDMFNSDVLHADLNADKLNVEFFQTWFLRDLNSHDVHPLDKDMHPTPYWSAAAKLSKAVWLLLTQELFLYNFRCVIEMFYETYKKADPDFIYKSLFDLRCKSKKGGSGPRKYQSFYNSLKILLESDEKTTVSLVNMHSKDKTYKTVKELMSSLTTNGDISPLVTALLSEGEKLILYFSSILTSKHTYLSSELNSLHQPPHTKVYFQVFNKYFHSAFFTNSINYNAGNCKAASANSNAALDGVKQSQYKIHLSPKLNYLYIIYQALHQELLKDRELEKEVQALKVLMNFVEQAERYAGSSIPPFIVIYVQSAIHVETSEKSEEGQAVQCALESRRKFLYVLKKILLLHQQWKSKLGPDIGLNLMSRGSYQVNDLIAVAHYLGGDLDYLQKKRNERKDFYESGDDSLEAPFEFASEEEKQCTVRHDMKYFKAKTRKGDASLGIPEIDYLPTDDVKKLVQDTAGFQR